MTQYLTKAQVLRAGSAACGFQVVVRDEGLLDAAVARPQASVFGAAAYPTLFLKAAALMHSIANNHPLVDGNKRTAWNSAWTFLTVNGVPVDENMDVDEAERFVLRVSADQFDLDQVAYGLKLFTA